MFTQLKPFDQMTADDYRALHLRAGLEIHQQLKTQKKLFCRCPAGVYSHHYDAEILRHMRPTLSELGEYDGTALMEFKTRKEIIYQINRETVCTYEMDDTPPFEINPQALDIALEVAMLLNYKMVNEIHIARKQYLDGSIPTGFQRTTIAGVDGWIPYRNKKIGLIQLGLEEDACREVSDIGHERVYRTDRLGMPLIEMVTRPDMHTPQEVADVANILRWAVRTTGKVRTGIGAARQDVNVSIRGGTRIEIKGVPRIPLIPLLIYNEASRQYALLQIREMLAHRGITEKSFKTKTEEVTQYLSKTSWDPIRNAIDRGEEVHCVKLYGYAGILSFTTQTGKVFSKEISDRVRVIACLTRLPNILTSESTEETIDSFAWKKIRNALDATSQDALVLVWGSKRDVQTGIQEIIIRAREATTGIPGETRQAFVDGTNGFERILPGPDRMYPDTDLPPLEITEDRLARLRKNLTKAVWERVKKYRRMHFPEHMIYLITASPLADTYDQMISDKKLHPLRLAHLMFETTRYWSGKGLPVEKLDAGLWLKIKKYIVHAPALFDVLEPLLENYLSASTSKKMLFEKLDEIAETPLQETQLLDHINQLKTTMPDGIYRREDLHRFFMNQLMQSFRGRMPAAEITEIVWKVV